MEASYLLNASHDIIEQINWHNGTVTFFGWTKDGWDKSAIFTQLNRVAIFKPKGSTIKTQPNK